MQRQLLLMRHAKSDWNLPLTDFDRPLNARGLAALDNMGRWLHARNLRIDRLYASPAQRAARTASGIAPFVAYSPAAIHWEPRLYHASLETLLSLLAEWLADNQTIMLVGHNPGLELLLLHLLPAAALKGRRKIFPTAAFADMALRLPDRALDEKRWFDATRGCAELNTLMFPKDI